MTWCMKYFLPRHNKNLNLHTEYLMQWPFVATCITENSFPFCLKAYAAFLRLLLIR